MPEATLAIVEDLVREAGHPIRRSYEDYDHLLDFIGDAPLVLLGEASHGTKNSTGNVPRLPSG